MWVALVTLVPVAVVLGLVAFGEHGGPLLEPTWRNLLSVGVAAVVLGPVAVGVLGLFGWLLAIALVVCLATTAGVWRGQRQAAAR